MKSAAFDYVKPKALQEALSLLEQGGDDARLIAGGQTLLATLNMRLSEPSVLIDITDIAELKGISIVGDSLRIGALVTHTEIEDSELVAKHTPLLKAAAPHIAHRAIRNLGTWGGSLAYGDPAAEWPACSLTLRATMIIHGPAGERRISANDFFIDLYTTSLEPDEILVATEIPLASKEEVFYFHELARRHGDYGARQQRQRGAAQHDGGGRPGAAEPAGRAVRDSRQHPRAIARHHGPRHFEELDGRL